MPEANDAARLSQRVDAVIADAGLRLLDLLTVDAELSEPRGLPAAMREMKDDSKVKSLGVAGECAALMPHVEAGAFDALITDFNLNWRLARAVHGAHRHGPAHGGAGPQTPFRRKPA